ncbi:MAG: radical SAM protein [Kofleriaceae bacterium]|nr:radical SAM protein [Kofleriaceae bacterium]
MSQIEHISVSYELTEHCNLRCSNCDHASPWMDDKFASLADYERDIRALAEVMHVNAIYLCGGEPLLHPQFLDFLRVTKESGIADGTIIISNGMLLHKMPEEAWDSIDAMVVSVYPDVRYRFDFNELHAVARAHGSYLIRKENNEFSKMLVNNRIEDPRLVRAIYKGCYAATNCHTLYDGRYYKCSRAHTLQSRMAKIGKVVENRAVDGIAIHGNPNLRAELEAYLRDDRPLKACEYCLGSFGRTENHVQLTKLTLKREQEEDHSKVADFLVPNLDLDHVTSAPPNDRNWWESGSRDYELFSTPQQTRG